jgi:hypothetical protein
MRPTHEQLCIISERLLGQCAEGLADVLEDMGFEENDLTGEDHDTLDQMVYHCPECGWWVEAYERKTPVHGGGEDVCEDCYDTQLEQEESEDGEDD